MVSELLEFLSGFIFFALHIDGGGVFPKPLSAKEERECFERMAHGDRDAKNKLIEHNLRLVAHIIKKYYANASDQEDLISIGTIGLIKAVNTFDYKKGCRFATYGSRCVENEVLMHFRSLRKTAAEVHFDEPVEQSRDGSSLRLIDMLADSIDVEESTELKLRCEALAKQIDRRLDEREREIIKLRYGLSGELPLTQRETAQRLSISRSYVSRIEKKALEKLRD